MPQQRTTVALIALSLFLGTLIVYYPALKNGFVNYDDPAYVTSNWNVQQGLTSHSVKWAFTSTTEANWHPLTWISHMLDVQLFGPHPAGHHAQSVLWHAVNVALLFLLLTRATGFVGRSAIVAALFAVHPLNVESVAWVAERKTVLCTFFLLLALGLSLGVISTAGVASTGGVSGATWVAVGTAAGCAFAGAGACVATSLAAGTAVLSSSESPEWM